MSPGTFNTSEYFSRHSEDVSNTEIRNLAVRTGRARPGGPDRTDIGSAGLQYAHHRASASGFRSTRIPTRDSGPAPKLRT